MSTRADFFVIDRPLESEAPSYVLRPADVQLVKNLLAGNICLVFAARQQGKSSLMRHCAERLRREGISVASVDLRPLAGSSNAKNWYKALLWALGDGLVSRTNLDYWWEEHHNISPVQLLMKFLSQVLLEEVKGRVVIFVDEIDSTLNLDFRDDFFAGIRAIYNERANDPDFRRVTFVLLGVASPTDLVQDTTRTPFNIGVPIRLHSIRYSEAAPLIRGLEAAHPGQGDNILRQIFRWTNGHPYLTQKLCLVAAERPSQQWDNHAMDTLVAASFFGRAAQDDVNLTFVREQIGRAPQAERQRILALYRRVLTGETVRDNEDDPDQRALELVGLIRRDGDLLQVHNEIYRHVFDRAWVDRAANRQRWLIWALIAATVLLVAGGLLFPGGLFEGWWRIVSGPTPIVQASPSNIPTELSSPTTEQPSPTTEQPSPTTEQPSPTTEQPSPTTEQPSPTTELPSPTTELPSPTTELPSPTTELPSPTTELPVAKVCTSSGARARARPAPANAANPVVFSYENGASFEPDGRTVIGAFSWLHVQTPAGPGWIYIDPGQPTFVCSFDFTTLPPVS